MPVGATIGHDQVNNTITSLAVRMRDLMEDVTNLDLSVNGQGQGLAYLESIGFSGTPNPANPGGISDAELAQNTISYLTTVAKMYYGQVVTSPAFNFNQQLSAVWAGQI
jgi:hypothetical protein